MTVLDLFVRLLIDSIGLAAYYSAEKTEDA